MQTFIQLLVILFLISCRTSEKGRQIGALKSDTIRLNETHFIEYKRDGRLWSINALSGDTIIKSAPHYFEATFPDIDEDGFYDIRVSIFSNTPNQSENYLYDSLNQIFQKIENSDLDIKKLKGVSLYFSYNSIGCSDNNWESHLSKIENWKEIPIGHIVTKDCGEKNDGVYIYKADREKEILLNVMPIDSLAIKNDKWNFIQEYWERNYIKFN